jgi:hypothetical protein
MLQAAKILIVVGLVIFIAGCVFYLATRLNLPLGRLPGDIHLQRGNLTCLIPIISSILISILLTIGLNLLLRWLNR